MGYMCHHAIIVTGSDPDDVRAARDEAVSIGMAVTEIIDSVANCYTTFLVGPDGSKEGWDDSDVGDVRRYVFIGYLQSTRSGLDWCVVQYGDEDGRNRMLLSDIDPEEPTDA